MVICVFTERGQHDRVVATIEARIEPLTGELAAKHSEALLALNADSTWVKWTRENLLCDRPLKWQLSSIALVGEFPVGYAVASRRADAVHLHRMFVDKSWRGMGIGRALLAHIASKGSEVGASRLTLKVLEMNSRALAFYRRHGFDIIGTEHDSYLLMEARINDVIQMTRLSPDRQ